MTHLVIAYMFAFIISAFVICFSVIKKSPGIIASIPVILLSGLSLSAAYILPVILEKRYLNLETFTTETNDYIYSNLFILPDMTSKFSDQGGFWPVYYNTMALHTVIFCLLILLFLFTSMKYRKSEDCGPASDVNTFFLAAAVCSILLMFGISSFVWKTIPFFKYILFPTRWLHMTAFAVAFLSATEFSILNSDNKTNLRLLIIPVILLSSCFAWDFKFITSAPSFDEKEIFPAKAVNIILEHLPKEVLVDKIEKIRDPNRETRFSIQGGGRAEVVSWKSAEMVLDVTSDGTLVVRFRTFNFPGWTAWLDEKRIEIKTEAGTGAILLDVPGGRHRIRLVFRDTPIRLAGKLISFAASITLIVIIITGTKGQRMFIVQQ